MHSIIKNKKIQKFFQIITPQNRENSESSENSEKKSESEVNLSQKIQNNTLKKTNETIQSKELLDFFQLPDLKNIEDLIVFFKEIDEDITHYYAEWEYKRPQFEKNFILAANKAIEELRRKEWFEIGENSLPRHISSLAGFLTDYKKIQSASKNNRKIHYDLVLFLKNIKNLFRIIEADFTEIDYSKNYIHYTQTEFLEKIANIFTENPDIFKPGNFTIHKEDFSKSHYFKVEWIAHIDGKNIPFEAEFGEKSLNRVLSKMNGDNKYGIPEFIRDLHRGRIKTSNPQDALFLGKIFLQHLGELEAHIKWDWLTEEDIDLYRRQYTADNPLYNLILKYAEIKNKKNISADMQEFRLSRAYHNEENPGFELQFVPKENHNETGFAHHSIYEMKWEIREILENYPRLYEEMIDKIIHHFHEKWLQKEGNPLDLSKEQIKEHIMENLHLVEISDSRNPINIKKRAFSNQKNLEKYPTLFAHTKTTYISLKKFSDFFDGKNYWTDQETYIKMNKIHEKMQKVTEKIQEIIWNIHANILNTEKNEEIRKLLNEQESYIKQMQNFIQK